MPEVFFSFNMKGKYEKTLVVYDWKYECFYPIMSKKLDLVGLVTVQV